VSRQPLLSEHAETMSTLDAVRGASFAPGSNLRGGGDGANWCFLLPSLELGRVVCLGPPSEAALTTLARLGAEVVVYAPRRQLEGLRSAAEGLPGVSLLERSPSEPVPLPDESADLIFLATRASGRVNREIERLLRPEGALYAEYRAFTARRRYAGLDLGRLGPAQLLWLAPAAGEVRVAAPLEDRRTIAYLESRFLAGRLLGRRLLRHPLRVLGREPVVNRLARRRGVLVQRRGSASALGPPRYLQAIAARARVDLAGRGWGLAAQGVYSSQKLLLFFFEAAGEAPVHVVKITREPRHNPRLENEWRALNRLREHGIGSDGTLPEPLFLDSHGTLAVLGETAIDGVPFLGLTTATAKCPYARAAIDWLLELGIRTAHRAPNGMPRAAGVLGALVDRFDDVYRVERDHKTFLAVQAGALLETRMGLPLVFQHGDPGPWNVLVTADGRPAFLDWEAAEPAGMPLWDLFHFVRSFGLVVSRAAGRHDPLGSFSDQILADSELGRLLAETTSRFCAQTGLAPSLVEPLFYLSWMHRALKEAARLPEDKLEQGRYVNLLRLAIERRDSPGLQRLFTLPAPC
jgi:SAM-dependent methyltransferase